MKKDNMKYWKIGVTVVAVVVVSLLCFFLLFRIDAILAVAGTVARILAPFLYGAVIAYILTPLCNRLERLLRGLVPSGPARGLSILIALVLAVLLVWALVMLVFPQVWDSILSIALVLPGQVSSAMDWLHDFLAAQPELQAWWDSFSVELMAELDKWARTELLPTAQNVLGGIGTQVAGFLGVVKNLFLGVLISIYILAGRKVFARQVRMLARGALPRTWAALLEEEVRYADRMFNGFLLGKLLDSAIVGVLCFVGLSLLRIEAAALISVIIGVTNIIPFFGPFIGAIPCALLLLLKSPVQCLVFLVFVVVLQQVDGNLIGPNILGNTTGLSSFWVLFAILLFGGLWGVFGMIVGVPLFAVIYDIVRRLTRWGLKRHGWDEEAEPPPPES